MVDYRSIEIQNAVKKYINEINEIKERRMDLNMDESHATKELMNILHADNPKMLSPIFKDRTREVNHE